MSMTLLEGAVTRANKAEAWQEVGDGVGNTGTLHILIAGIVKLLFVLPCSLTVEGCHRASGHQRLSGQCRSMRLRHVLLALALCTFLLGACASEPRTPFTEADQMATVPTGTRSIRYWADAR